MENTIVKSSIACAACNSYAQYSGVFSNVLICPSCSEYNYFRTGTSGNKKAGPIIQNNSSLKQGTQLKVEGKNTTILGLQQIYFNNGYSNWWYAEQDKNKFVYLEESFGTTFCFNLVEDTFPGLLTKSKNIGATVDIKPFGKLVYSAIRKIEHTAAAGELLQLNDFSKTGFLLEAFHQDDSKKRFRFFIFDDKKAVGLKGNLIDLKSR